MIQSIEESFLIDFQTGNNGICCDLLLLKLEVDELINYFKVMDKKSKIALAVIKKAYNKFPETQTFVSKA